MGRRTRRRARGNKILMDQFQTARVVVTSDWCHKTKTEHQNQKSCRVVSCRVLSYYMKTIHTGQLLAIFVWVVCQGITRGEKFQSQNKIEWCFFAISAQNSPEIGWTFRRYCMNIIVFKICDFLYNHRCR